MMVSNPASWFVRGSATAFAGREQGTAVVVNPLLPDIILGLFLSVNDDETSREEEWERELELEVG